MHEELKQIVVVVVVHLNKVDVNHDDEDVVDDDDGDDVEFEENVERIDMFHVVLLKEKLEYHCLEREKKERKIVKIKFVLDFYLENLTILLMICIFSC